MQIPHIPEHRIRNAGRDVLHGHHRLCNNTRPLIDLEGLVKHALSLQSRLAHVIMKAGTAGHFCPASLEKVVLGSFDRQLNREIEKVLAAA